MPSGEFIYVLTYNHSKLGIRNSPLLMMCKDLAIGHREFLVDEHERLATADYAICTAVKASI